MAKIEYPWPKSIVLAVAALLAGCTVSVANLAPTPATGDRLTLVQEVMAEAAKRVDESESLPADRAIAAVEAWRGAEDSE